MAKSNVLRVVCPPAPAPVHTTDPAGVIVTYGPASASGGRAPYRFQYSKPSGSLFPPGSTPVEITVLDAQNKTDRCHISVQVVLDVPVPPPSTSADGTTVPPDIGIVDASGAMWRLDNGYVLRDGAGVLGWQASKILWYGGQIYVLGNDSHWWQWNGTAWQDTGTVQPGTSGSMVTSPDGTTVPPASQIVDDAGNVWTLASGQTILRNGQKTNGLGSSLYWYQRAIYTLGIDLNWWQWTGSNWTNVGSQKPGAATPPPPTPATPSPDGTIVPPATSVVDSAGATWTLGAGASVLKDGASAAGGLGSKILWYGGKIYVLGTDNNWWQWNGTAWQNAGAQQPGGTPPPPPPPTPDTPPPPDTPLPTNPVVPQKALVTLNDLELVAAWYGVGMYSRGYGMTFYRGDDGRLKIWEWANDGNIWEYEPPLSAGVPASPPYGQLFDASRGAVNLGVPFGTYGGFYWEPRFPANHNVGDMNMSGIHWEKRRGLLHVQSNTFYNTDSNNSEKNYGLSRFDPVARKFVPLGMWYTDEPRRPAGDPLPSGHGNRMFSGFTNLPDWLAAMAGGRRIGLVGGGGYFSGIHSNNSSMGPTLFALGDVPETTPYATRIPNPPIPILFHPFHEGNGLNTVTYPTRTNNGASIKPRTARRQRHARKLNKYANPTNTHNGVVGLPDDLWLPDPDGTEYWSPNGDSCHAGVYIETPTREAYVVFPTLIEGFVEARVVADAVHVGTFGGMDFFDLLLDTVVGLEPNMQGLWLEDPTGPSYGGWVLAIAHNANSGQYAPNLPDGSTTNPINGNTVRVVVQNGNPQVLNVKGHRLNAGVWYGPGGGKSATYRTHMWSYSPQALANQLKVTDGDWSQLEPTAASYFPFSLRRETFLGYPYHAAIAAAYDKQDNLLVVRVFGGDGGPAGGENRHVCYAFRVKPAP